MVQGLLLARAYFTGGGDEEELRRRITTIWEEVEWDFFTNGEENGLYWHWSPNSSFGLGMKIQGFNECLIAYVLAMSSPTHPISARTFSHWSAGYGYQSRDIQGYRVNAALPGGGPLFLTHYSFIGLDPWLISDAWVPEGYLLRNTRQTLANRGYCLYAAPRENMYSAGLWGLTASMIPGGYAASDPVHDHGVVAPTAALSSFPYAPHYAFEVLKTLRRDVRGLAWGPNGPYDAVSVKEGWSSRAYLAIDQLPIVAMVENYRSGLLWRLFMGIPEIQAGLAGAGLAPPRLCEGFPEAEPTLIPDGDDYLVDAYEIRPHPDTGRYRIPFWIDKAGQADFRLLDETGRELLALCVPVAPGRNWLEFPPDPLYHNKKCTLVFTATGGVHRLPLRLHAAGVSP